MMTITKRILLVTMVFSLIMSGITVSANNQSVKYTFKDGTLTVSGTGVADTFDKSVCKVKDIKRVVIRSGITELGKFALPEMKKVDSITIPKTVKTIAQSAIFCEKLKKLVMPGEFTCVVPPAKEGEDWESYYPYPSILVIPADSIHLNTPIKKMNQTKYMSFLSKKIYTSKNDKKFKSYNGLIYTKNGGKLVYVPCETKKMRVREGCKTLSMRAFTYSTDVEGDASALCNKIKKVVIPKTVRKIINDTFEPGYDAIRAAKWTIKTRKLTGVSIKNLSLMVRKKYLTKAMKNNRKIIKKVRGMWITKDHILVRYDGKAKKVTVPKGVKSIAESAFGRNHKIRFIKLPKSLTNIENYAFWQCYKLKTVKWNKKLKTIGRGAFEGAALKTLKLPNSVKSFGEESFADCGLTKIVFPKSMKKIPKFMFTNSRVKKLVIPGHIKTIGMYAFSQSKGDTLIIQDGVKNIEYGAFDGYGSYNKVILAKSLKNIEENAFSSTRIKKLVLNGMNAKVGKSAFYGTKEIDCGNNPSKYITYAYMMTTEGSGKFNCVFDVIKVTGASGLEVEISKNKDFSNPIQKDLKNESRRITIARGSNGYINYRIRVYTLKNGNKIYGPWNEIDW